MKNKEEKEKDVYKYHNYKLSHNKKKKAITGKDENTRNKKKD